MRNAVRRLSERMGFASDQSRRTVVIRRTLIGFSVAVVATAVLIIVTRPAVSPSEVTSYSGLLHALDAGEVSELVIRPGEGIRAIPTGELALRGAAAGEELEELVVVYPLEQTDVLVERALNAGVSVSFERPADAARAQRLLGMGLGTVLLIGLGYVLLRQLRGQFGERDVGRKVQGSDTTFRDVAGTQGAAEDLQEVVDFLRQPKAYTELGARVPKGVLLFGAPGTGKTLLARAVAGEAGVPFFQLSGSEVTGFIVGLGAHRIRSLFKKARRDGGVIFIDEIDSLGSTRGRNRSHNEDDRTLNQLLVELDGFSPTDGIVVIGATNRPDDLDPALKRPGRFDRIVTVGLPSVSGREAILRLHADRRGVPLAPDADLARVARLTPGASGADLANLLNEAAIGAVRGKSPVVRWSDFESARDRFLLGKERVGFQALEDEWRIVAVHEAGHALAGVLCCPEDGLHKVTIQARGRAMGVAHFSPDDDRHLHSRRYLEGQLVKSLAGRAAEEAILGFEHVTGGAESDLVQANRIARRMILRLGMGERTGLLIQDEDGMLSPDSQAAMDGEVRALLGRQYARAQELVREHRAALEALAAALLEHETLDGEAALRVLEEHGVEPPRVSAA